MCRAGRVRLSPAETKEVKRFYGTWAPVYASVALLIVAAMTVTSRPRPDGSLLAKNAAPSVASLHRSKSVD